MFYNCIVLLLIILSVQKYASSWNSVCFHDKDEGPCKALDLRYYYNWSAGVCTEFEFGGCNGNGNNFLTFEECNKTCGRSGTFDKSVCILKPDPGTCRGYFSRYFYNKEKNVCEQFIYGGCLGNENNFKTKEECDAKCATTLGRSLNGITKAETTTEGTTTSTTTSTTNTKTEAPESPGWLTGVFLGGVRLKHAFNSLWRRINGKFR
uniref:BPTI/Kunitz inhibitor domain-containing protein n=1 Tax=Trichobilharzia regenti TaxID=157069 RepID=A0AA85K5E9_TRIRE|nr:unnamed protein product [Trichobilharzia regenti]